MVGGSPGPTKHTVPHISQEITVRKGKLRAIVEGPNKNTAEWPGGLAVQFTAGFDFQRVHGGLAGIFGICNFPSVVCLFFWLFKIGSFPILVTVLATFLGYQQKV